MRTRTLSSAPGLNDVAELDVGVQLHRHFVGSEGLDRLVEMDAQRVQMLINLTKVDTMLKVYPTVEAAEEA